MMKLKIFVFFALVLLCFPVSSAAQRIKTGESTWYWRTKPDKDNASYQLTVSLKIKGKKVTGELVARGLDNDEWNGGDGALTLFVGRVVGNKIQIEYNNADWRNAESDDIFKPYRRPKRKARYTATLRFRGKTLEFLQNYGRRKTGYPRKMIMVSGEDIDKTGK